MHSTKDFIVSGKTGETFAEITIQVDEKFKYGYEGVILKNTFPKVFIDLLKEFDKRVDEGAFGALDDIENDIYAYIPMLKFMNTRVYQVKINDNKISFFTKYPTGKGFIDEFPE